MKKSKSAVSLFLAVLLALAFLTPIQPAAAAGVEEGARINVRVEYADRTLFTLSEVEIGAGTTFAGLGFKGLAETGYITPLHALAARFRAENPACDDQTLGEYIGVSQGVYGPYLTYLDADGAGGEAPSANGLSPQATGLVGSEYGWMFAINDQVAEVGFGEAKLTDGDTLVVFAGHYTSVSSGSYTAFAEPAYQAERGDRLNVCLLGTNIFAAGAPRTPVSGAGIEILDDTGNNYGDSDVSGLDFGLSDAQGMITIDAGDLLDVVEAYGADPASLRLSAVKKDLGQIVISRPFATLAISERTTSDTQAVNADRQALTIETTASANRLLLPQYGQKGSTITWTSDNENVLSSSGQVRARPEQGSVTLTLRASITCALAGEGATAEKYFTINVPAASSANLREIRTSEGQTLRFDGAQNEATLEIPAALSKVLFSPVCEDEAASVTINSAFATAQDGAKGWYSADMNLAPLLGIKIQVHAAVGEKSRDYTLKLKRKDVALPGYTPLWASFRAGAANNALSNAKTPRNSEEAYLSWEKTLRAPVDWDDPDARWTNLSEPILAGDFVYIAHADKVYKLSAADGGEAGCTQLKAEIDSVARMVYAEGMLFVPLTGGRVQALHGDTLAPLWVSEEIPDHQSLTSMNYHDGHLYFGTADADAYHSYAGSFLCFDTADDPAFSDEIKAPLWRYDGGAAYYWSGAAVAGDALIFGGDDGKLVSHALKDARVLDTYDIGEKIRSTVVYEDGALYFTDYAGMLYRVEIQTNGTFGACQSVRIGAGSTSSPAIYNGRIYVGGYRQDYSGTLAVVDADSMQLIYETDAPGEVKASPLVVAAYESELNHHSVYVYYTANINPGSVYCLRDYQGADTGDVSTLFTPQGAGGDWYCMASMIADDAGSLYYTSDSGKLFKIGVKQTEATALTLKQPGALPVGESTALKSILSPAQASTPVQYFSSDPEIAYVQDGRLYGRKAGEITLSAVAGELYDAKSVRVVPSGAKDSGGQEDDAPPASPITGDKGFLIWPALLLSAGAALTGLLYRRRVKR